MEKKTRAVYPEIEFLTKLMDDQFELLGFRFGLNIFEIIPGVGDIATTVVALYIFGLAAKYNTSAWTKFRMLWNIAVYFLVGLVPGVGDAFSLWYKPNRRNLRLLKKKAVA